MNNFEAIVLGVSAGGMRALATITPALPEDFALPLIVVQHMAKDSDGYLFMEFGRFLFQSNLLL